MDEKGLQMGKSARVKVIYVRGRKSPPLMKDGNLELITAIETIAGDGAFLPPMIIYKGQAQLAKCNGETRSTAGDKAPGGTM